MSSSLFPRILLFGAGLYIMALGVSLSVAANLGTSPISCLPYVLSVVTSLSMGFMTFLMNIVLIILQMIILKRGFKVWYLLQLPGLLVFSLFIDLNNILLEGVVPDLYAVQLPVMLLSCVVLAFGIALLLKADLIMMPGDALARAITQVSGKKFGVIKVALDVTLVAVAAAISLIFLQGIVGIREGSLAAALSVGFLAGLFRKLLSRREQTYIRSRGR
ncbi:MAG: DUF6198 family protein [Methanocorpusculum sp.]|nr:DUF6198 family protein [Methanocorpusculum sp.]